MQTSVSSRLANMNPLEFLLLIMGLGTLPPTTGVLSLHTCVPVCLFPTMLPLSPLSRPIQAMPMVSKARPWTLSYSSLSHLPSANTTPQSHLVGARAPV